MSTATTVLLVLPNWLGDVVMATPLIERLTTVRDTNGRPLRLVAAIRDTWAPLLADDPRLDELLIYERGGRHGGWAGALRLASQWRATGARATVLCPPSFRVALVASLAGVRPTVGYHGDGRRWLLSRPLPAVHPRGTLHHAEELAALGDDALAALAIAPVPMPLPMPELPHLNHTPPCQTDDGPPVWVLAPGATYGSAKAWPPARVAEFLTLAVQEHGVRVAMVGDGAGHEICAAIRDCASNLEWRTSWSGGPGVVDLVGTTTLLDLVSVLRAAKAFVGNDSGVMHLSAALGVPTLGIFGSSSVAWTAPRGRRAAALAAEGFACQPCFRTECNQPRFCLETIGGAAALAALERLLEVDS